MNTRKMNSIFRRINLRKIFIACFVIATYAQFKKSSRHFAEIHSDTSHAEIHDDSNHLVKRVERSWEPVMGRKETIHLPELAREEKTGRRIEAEEDITDEELRLYRRLSNITFLEIADDDIPPYSTIQCRPDLGLRIPNIIHFIWFGPLELKLHQYLSLRSAAAIQRPNILYLHLDTENTPTGPYWQRLQDEVPCLEIGRHQPPYEIFGRPLYYPAHKSDILRMELLYNYGGIYADINVYFLKSMDDLMNNSFVIGKEEEGYYGNSFMLAEPNAPFIKEWYGRYTTFLPWQWNEHSTHLPPRIQKECPELEIYVDKFALMRPNYRDGVDWILKKNWDLTYNYCVHLYENTFELQFAPVLAMEEKEMIKINATYGQLVRKALYGTLFFKDERTNTEKVISDYAPVECGEENPFPTGIPNTLHFIWKYKKKFNYHYYLSIRSAALAFRPNSIVFHIFDSEEEVEEPFDLLWVRLNHEVPCITLNRLPFDFGRTERGYEAEARELNRKLQIAIEYGGIVLDLHMITVNNFNPSPASPAVLAWDNTSYSDLVVIGEQNSTILREWLVTVTNDWKNTTDILKQIANEPDIGPAVISNPIQMADDSWYDSNTSDLSSLQASAYYFSFRFVLEYAKIEETLLQQDTLYGQLVRLIVMGSTERLQV